MDLLILKDLLPLMRDCRVESLRLDAQGALEIKFQTDAKASVTTPLAPQAPAVALEASAATALGAPAVSSLKTEKVEDVVVPQSADEEMSFDKILNWSAPATDEGDVPLTGDAPLAPETSMEVSNG